MSDIGDKIREAREKIGMTQDELGYLMGYKGKAAISKIETGVVGVSQSKIAAFAKHLKTTPAYLMGWEDEAEAKRHYESVEAREIAQALHDRPELRIVFDAAKNVGVEDLLLVSDLIERLAKKDQ